MSQEEQIEKGFQEHFASITTEKKPDKKVQLRMFRHVGIDPNAPIDGTGIDANIQKEVAKSKSLHELLSDAKRNYTETTGKPAGGGKKRRKTKRNKSTFKKSGAKKRAQRKKLTFKKSGAKKRTK
jgi:hypothetical protein